MTSLGQSNAIILPCLSFLQDKVGKFCKIGKVVTVREFTSELSEDLVEMLLFFFYSLKDFLECVFWYFNRILHHF